MKTKLIGKYLIIFTMMLLPFLSPAAFLKNIPQTITLPDLSIIHCFATGDEFFNYLHDENGFTLIFDDDGFLYYAINENGLLKPSVFRVNSVSPKSKGIEPGNLVSPQAYRQFRSNFSQASEKTNSPLAPHTGILNNLVVYIRFSGESEFTDLTSYYGDMFNSMAPNANSLRSYYYETSYSQLQILTTFYPLTTGPTVISFQDSHTRNYFEPYNATSNPGGYPDKDAQYAREHQLLMAATYSVAGQIPPGLNIDMDNDGYVDNINYIIYGEPNGWGTLLWPHRGIYVPDLLFINGKQVYTYNLHLQTMIYSFGNGVIAHEMFHSLGAPDLYHYNTPWKSLKPVGQWDLMENTTNPPQHMSAYMKSKYGLWAPAIPVCTANGYYTLNPLNSATSQNTCFRINSPNSTTEFFVVEYRRKTGTYESSLPGEGMIIYRINSAFHGNAYYDSANVFDEVYAYRPGGSITLNGLIEYANYSQLVDRTALNCTTDPSPYLTLGGASDIFIRDITDHNGTLSFLLLKNFPYNLLLNQPDTYGIYAATNEVSVQNGFTSGPSNSFEATLTGCTTNQGYASHPVLSLDYYKVQLQNKQSKFSNTYTFESMGNTDIHTLRNKINTTAAGLPDGDYTYIISREGVEIDHGSMVIK